MDRLFKTYGLITVRKDEVRTSPQVLAGLEQTDFLLLIPELFTINSKKFYYGAITITADVTSVTATKGTGSVNNKSIGKGDNSANGTQTCGTITIGGVEKEQSEFTGDTYTYPPRTYA